MSQSYYSPERRWDQPLLAKIDFDALIFQALQMVNTAFQSPEFRMEEFHNKAGGSTESRSKISMDRFENSVLLVKQYIQPDWIDKDNREYPARYAKYQKQFNEWVQSHNEWAEQFKSWEKGPTVPMTKEAWEAYRPPEPPPPEKPQMYSQQIKECNVIVDVRIDGVMQKIRVWKSFDLYEALISLLHRQGFFETKHRRAKL